MMIIVLYSASLWIRWRPCASQHQWALAAVVCGGLAVGRGRPSAARWQQAQSHLAFEFAGR